MLILLIVKGNAAVFACVMTIVAGLGLLEFTRMTLPQRRFAGVALSFVGALLTLVPSYAPQLLLPALTLLLFLLALLLLFKFSDIRLAAQEWALLSAGILYLPLLISQLVLLRSEPYGSSWILLMLLIVMSGDSAAYYIGSAFGKHKLYPAVSPNKSVEGALGGLAGSLAGALIAKFTFFPQLRIMDCIVTALALGVLGQLGDLFESLLKRSCGVKDSGCIVPGHGGILDRLDSILFAAPAAWWYAHFIFARV